jgi:3-oxoadipate enol-lactonase
VVLIHELGGSVASWDAVAAKLSPHRQVLRFDQRGHGLSEKVRTAYSLAQHVDDLRAVLDHVPLPAPCWLVSAAAGAAIAVSFAARFPQRVAGLVMCGPALDADAARRSLLEQRADLAVTQGMRAIAEATLARSWPQAIRTDTAAFEAYRARLLAADPLGYAFANRALGEMDLAQVLGQVQCPSLLMAGRHDLLRPPEQVERQVARFSHGEFAVVPSGHLMAVQNPHEVVERLSAFIQRNEPQ